MVSGTVVHRQLDIVKELGKSIQDWYNELGEIM